MKYLIALLAVVGIIVSTMALRVHYMDPAQAPPCAVTEKFDCGAVNHSRFAVFPPRTFNEDPKAGSHIPIAMFGILGYAAIGVLALMSRWWLLFEVTPDSLPLRRLPQLYRSLRPFQEVVHLLPLVTGHHQLAILLLSITTLDPSAARDKNIPWSRMV